MPSVIESKNHTVARSPVVGSGTVCSWATRPTVVGPEADQREEDDGCPEGEHAGDHVDRLRPHGAEHGAGGEVGDGEAQGKDGLERGHRPAPNGVRRAALHDAVLRDDRDPVRGPHHEERHQDEREQTEEADPEGGDGHAGRPEHHPERLRAGVHPPSEQRAEHGAGPPAGDQQTEAPATGPERFGQRSVGHHPHAHPEDEHQPGERHPAKDRLAEQIGRAGEEALVLRVRVRSTRSCSNRPRDRQGDGERDEEGDRVQPEDDGAGQVQPVRARASHRARGSRRGRRR